MHDTVSVIIPCFKQACFLTDAIESVLAQSYPHLEVIVVDDGSPDDTSDVASRYPGVRYIRQENQGLSAARNTGIRESQGEFLVFLDADDRLTPKALESGVQQLRQCPSAAFVAGKHRHISIDGSPLPSMQSRHIDRDHYVELLRANYIGCPANVMYRRAVFDDVHGFDTSLRAVEDYDLYLRVARKFVMACHRNVVAEYRTHGDSMSSNHKLMLEQVITVLRSQLKQVSGNRRHEEACRTGMKFYQHHYRVALLIDRMRSSARKQHWRGTLWNMLLLVWFDPRALAETLGRKARLEILKRRRSSRWMPGEEVQ
jgi:glycosyltransferase involved in cell wall biosynthesis